MTRVAIFVDVGYLYSAGAVALTGSPNTREGMDLEQRETIARLKVTTNQVTNEVPILRIYWYDGLVRGRLSQEQQALARSNGVKLRLGVVTAGRQKGVDSLIVTDLIELARNHAISDAVLMSGDEDLRIGVQIAQSFGVRVHLIGIEPSRGNQSDLLMQEADTTTEWSRNDIQGILSLRLGVETELRTSLGQASSSDSEDNAGDILDQVASDVVRSIDADDLKIVADTLTQNPGWIPPEFDRKLLLEGAQKLGRELEQGEKRRVRDEFRETVKNIV